MTEGGIPGRRYRLIYRIDRDPKVAGWPLDLVQGGSRKTALAPICRLSTGVPAVGSSIAFRGKAD